MPAHLPPFQGSEKIHGEAPPRYLLLSSQCVACAALRSSLYEVHPHSPGRRDPPDIVRQQPRAGKPPPAPSRSLNPRERPTSAKRERVGATVQGCSRATGSSGAIPGRPRGCLLSPLRTRGRGTPSCVRLLPRREGGLGGFREVEAGQMKVQGPGAEPAPSHCPLLGGLRAWLVPQKSWERALSPGWRLVRSLYM